MIACAEQREIFLRNLRVLGYVLKLRHLYDLSTSCYTICYAKTIFFFFCYLITVNLYFKMGIQRIYDNVLYILHFLYKLIVKSSLKAPVMQ